MQILISYLSCFAHFQLAGGIKALAQNGSYLWTGYGQT